MLTGWNRVFGNRCRGRPRIPAPHSDQSIQAGSRHLSRDWGPQESNSSSKRLGRTPTTLLTVFSSSRRSLSRDTAKAIPSPLLLARHQAPEGTQGNLEDCSHRALRPSSMAIPQGRSRERTRRPLRNLAPKETPRLSHSDGSPPFMCLDSAV